MSKPSLGMARNLEFQRNKANILKDLPFAKLRPKKKVPLRRIFDGINDTYSFKMPKYSRERQFSESVLNKLKRNQKAKVKRLTDPGDDTEFIKQRFRRMSHVAKSISDQSSKLYDLLVVMREKRDSVDVVRKNFSEMFYGGCSITGQAMGAVIASEISFLKKPDKKKPRYNLPPMALMDKLATDLGFTDVAALEAEALKGSQLKTFKQIKYGSKTKSKVSGELGSLYERVDTKMAKDKLQDNEDAYVECDSIDDISVDAASDEEFVRVEAAKLQDVLDQDVGRFKSTPFLHDKTYTYKLLYLAYLNYFGYILPFGKTLPSLGWMLVFSYYIDPENSLGLRLNMTNFVLKVGGLPLLEKHSLLGDPDVEKLRMLFKPSLTSAGSTTIRKAATAVLMNTVSTRNIHLKQSELTDEIQTLKEELSEHMKSYHSVLKYSNLANNAKHVQEGEYLQDSVNLAFSDDSDVYHHIIERILLKHDVEYKRDIPSPEQFYQNFTPAMEDTAELVVKYAKLWKSGKAIGKQWFIFSLMNDCNDIEKSCLARFKRMSQTNGYEASIRLLTHPHDMTAYIRQCFDEVDQIIGTHTMSQLNSMLDGSGFKSNVTRREWATIDIDDVLRDDPVLKKLVDNAIKVGPDKVKKTYSKYSGKVF